MASPTTNISKNTASPTNVSKVTMGLPDYHLVIGSGFLLEIGDGFLLNIQPASASGSLLNISKS